MALYCTHCDTPFKGTNHPESGTGHWEEVNVGGDTWEVWYCCHICRDNNEPCESFFPIEE